MKIQSRTAVALALVLALGVSLVPGADSFAAQNEQPAQSQQTAQSEQTETTETYGNQDVEQLAEPKQQEGKDAAAEFAQRSGNDAASEKESSTGADGGVSTDGEVPINASPAKATSAPLATSAPAVQSSKAKTASSKKTTSTKKTPAPATKFILSGVKVKFKTKVNQVKRLPAETVPTSFKLKAKKRSLKLTWKRPKAYVKADGYILLRRAENQVQYKEVARVGKRKTSYVDHGAWRKDRQYYYICVPYKEYKKGKELRIGPSCTPWVSGVTKASKTRNLYKPKIKNESQLTAMIRGKSVQAAVDFPKKIHNRNLRWSSGNPAIVSVSPTGLVTARRAGVAKVSVKSATGRIKVIRVKVSEPASAMSMLEVMRSWVGYSEKNKKHRKIIDIYNSYKPHPRNYKMKYSDAWCDACISAAAIKSGNAAAVGVECGVPSHIKIFKKKKIWIEDGTITPIPGDIIVFAWSKSKQPNNRSGSHIGIVDSVSKGKITTIEGNCSDKVKRRTIPVGWGYIRGYARPKYVK